VKKLIGLLIAGALIWAAVHTVPVYLRFFQFDEAVKEVARFANTRTEQEVRERILALADQYEIPLEAEDLIVRKVQEETEISVVYVERVEILPRYFYDWEFDVTTPSWSSTAPEPDQP
jgi:hypothetical protein